MLRSDEERVTPKVDEERAMPRMGEERAMPRMGEERVTPKVDEDNDTPKVGEERVTPRMSEERASPRAKRGVRYWIRICLCYLSYGLIDLLRRRRGTMPTAFVPKEVCPLEEECTLARDHLRLVDRDHPITADREGLIEVGGIRMDGSAKHEIDLLFADCLDATGQTLLFTDGYRTLKEQGALYRTEPYAVPAGESEHHTGLAVDIKTEGYGGWRFIHARAGRYVAKNAHLHGFTVRYSLWAKRKTGIEYEPWHLRYVGHPHAEIMYQNKLTLEEYLAFFEAGGFYRYGDHVISRQVREPLLFPPHGSSPVTVSDDGCGGKLLCGKIGIQKEP